MGFYRVQMAGDKIARLCLYFPQPCSVFLSAGQDGGYLDLMSDRDLPGGFHSPPYPEVSIFGGRYSLFKKKLLEG